MFAFVSNEFHCIVYTQSNLRTLCNMYSYPQFRKVNTYEEGMKFINSKKREFRDAGKTLFGMKKTTAYIKLEYFIDKECVFLNMHTGHFGFVSFNKLPSNMKSVSTYDLVKIKISDIGVNNDSISSHCVAIQTILKLINTSINVVLIIPDISIYLACTSYTGMNHSIKGVQASIRERIGKTVLVMRK